jgi:lipopolysaccharide transport system permease protein
MKHAGLIAELVRREFAGRYQGSLGGVLWALIHPLFLLSIYTLVFGVVLKIRWDGGGGTFGYALYIFAGLIIFNAFSECLIKAPAMIVGNQNFVKKVVFPLEILPLVSAIVALLHAAIGVAVWFLCCVIFFGVPKMTALLLPLIFIGMLPLLLGIGWVFSALGVMLRDTGQIVGIISHVLLFVTPIFYSAQSMPEPLRSILILNPLTLLVGWTRDLLLVGTLPGATGFFIYAGLSLAFAYGSLHFFRRVRPLFADLL